MSGYERFEDREKVSREVFEILEQVGAIRRGHFVGTSGRHMEEYFDKNALLKHPAETARIAGLFAERNDGLPIDVVVAPATGAIILGNRVAGEIIQRTGREEIRSVYTEKDENDRQVLKRGYKQEVSEKNVLIIEDTAATGLSLRQTIQAVQEAGGTVVQACVMVNRDTERINSETMGVPLDWLAEVFVETFDASECPLCWAKVPINTDVGHGGHV